MGQTQEFKNMLSFSKLNEEQEQDTNKKIGRESIKSKASDKRDQFSKNPNKFIKELKNLATVTGEDKDLHVT